MDAFNPGSTIYKQGVFKEISLDEPSFVSLLEIFKNYDIEV